VLFNVNDSAEKNFLNQFVVIWNWIHCKTRSYYFKKENETKLRVTTCYQIFGTPNSKRAVKYTQKRVELVTEELGKQWLDNGRLCLAPNEPQKCVSTPVTPVLARKVILNKGKEGSGRGRALVNNFVSTRAAMMRYWGTTQFVSSATVPMLLRLNL